MGSKTKIIFAFVGVMFLLIVISIYATINLNNYKEAYSWVAHSQEVISEAESVFSIIQDIESSQRGYTITAKDNQLTQYNIAVHNFEPAFARVRKLTQDNMEQQELLDSLHALLTMKIDFSKEVVATRFAFGFEAAQQLIASGVGVNLMEMSRGVVSKFIGVEKGLLATRMKNTRESYVVLIRTIIVSLTISVLFILITLFYFIRDYNRRLRSEKALLESELRTKSFLNALPVGVFVLNEEGKTSFVNKKSKELLGKGVDTTVSAAELGEVYDAYIAGTDERYPSERMPVVRALQGENNISTEDMEIEREGKRVSLRINANPIYNSEGQITYSIASFEDVTEIKNTYKELVKAKKQSEDLLLNILPAEVAEELKQKGYSEARQFETATVLFTDFKGFTSMAERLSPKELVQEIDECFRAFDRIVEKYNIEKIKTIGDAYMAVGGIPLNGKEDAVKVVSAAKDIRDFMVEHKKMKGADGFEIRIGIHSGPVVAGIVGLKKFAYDIWGDTVNVAARMESSGEVGMINISGTTYELIRDTFECTYRGKIMAKGKGEIDMYFVN